jgi:signal transduction histidine kinase
VSVSVRRGSADAEGAGCIEIRIEDDGPGMDELTLDRAFVPFFTTRPQGTGLGLALCERMVRELDGSIRLTSQPGEGTTVVIRLPEGKPDAKEGEA